MRFLLDTNIIIPLEDSTHVLEESLANFVRLAQENHHQLVYHPATEDDFRRDSNDVRRQQNLERLKRYSRLDNRTSCPWNNSDTKPNDAADNEILFALYCDAAHALVTEDRQIHDKAKDRGLIGRVYAIQTAEDWLRRLHEKTLVHLPNIENVDIYSLTPILDSEFFDSLRQGYPKFSEWFRGKARDGGKAWVAWEKTGILGAICIYAQQNNETITEEKLVLVGTALKLSTFKVGASVRGRKIGELFLKAAFRYATANRLENIFIHGDVDEHHSLFEMLEDFGFKRVGCHPGSGGRDAVYLKRHPVLPPTDENIVAFEYFRLYFPHFRHNSSVEKYVVPIRPEYHRVLFPDYNSPADLQLELFESPNAVGNAIKLAYLCHAQTKTINRGSIVMFYRSGDEHAITSLGVVEEYDSQTDPILIAGRVKRRTVYSMEEIEQMAKKPTKVMLFRLVRHFSHGLSQQWLKENRVLKRAPQSITQISNEAFETVLAHGR